MLLFSVLVFIYEPNYCINYFVIMCGYSQLLGQFIARCVADDCLPPKFITRYKGQVENEWVK